MLKIIGILLTITATSLYFFPLEFVFLPSVNTKMMLAAVGLVLYAVDMARTRSRELDADFVKLVVFASIVSLCGCFSMIVNVTPDSTYATYLISMLVWLGGAYAVASLMRLVHGRMDVSLVCDYLITVCVLQCASALMIDNIPAMQHWVESHIAGLAIVDMDKLQEVDRLYGLGASMDVAGSRFAVILAMIAFLTLPPDGRDVDWKQQLLYLSSFAFIVVVGNMISRTTIVGVAVALLWWAVVCPIVRSGLEQSSSRHFTRTLFLTLLVSVPLVVLLYNVNPIFHNYMRFGFEGFFSLFEKGYWETNSNNILKSMVVFPDNWKTWLIGDGYIENPYMVDPYYTGRLFRGYYMQTDIGYLRFIFYFGLIGLAAFTLYFIKTCQYCIRRCPDYLWLFVMILCINFIIWFKVSTDIFLVFALLFCGEVVQAQTHKPVGE